MLPEHVYYIGFSTRLFTIYVSVIRYVERFQLFHCQWKGNVSWIAGNIALIKVYQV